ncbi:hypothetical protein [Mucilaginibacter sp. NFR10]|uniref:hypothetical protein n=1 Tax=Mucilaginibacter sp. NFR10 TaxID=1566292 RepID=UPI00087145DA|nr:hypothetical protein [Mucilaginibacter sp. NFR10]SCW51183.1 hypothetical protein SAMN03159284_01573 [Mucilaginibacter sp. NFR10]
MAERYPRTDKDFLIESIVGLKDVTDRHTLAGFEDIPDEILYRRFFQLIDFLQKKQLTNVIKYNGLSDITINSELKNSDLNDAGFYFLQYALGKWESRFHKDQGDTKESEFIEKWYKVFVKNNPDLFF